MRMPTGNIHGIELFLAMIIWYSPYCFCVTIIRRTKKLVDTSTLRTGSSQKISSRTLKVWKLQHMVSRSILTTLTLVTTGKKRLMPKASDLSYYNWETQTSTSNSSPNFQVIADNETGLLFKNKRDRKVINVDPKVCARKFFLSINAAINSRRGFLHFCRQVQETTPQEQK